MSRKYKLKYLLDMKAGEFTKDELKPDEGATDALLIASILYPEDGSLSVHFVSRDGRAGNTDLCELADIEWFMVWSMLTARLARSETLSPQKKELCNEVFDVIRSATLKARKKEE